MKVVVFNNNVIGAVKLLNRKLQREGNLRILRLKSAFEKKTQKRRRETSECIRRALKVERKKAQYRGMVI